MISLGLLVQYIDNNFAQFIFWNHSWIAYTKRYVIDRYNFEISFTYQKYNQDYTQEGYKMKNAICHFMYIASYVVKTKTGGKYIL